MIRRCHNANDRAYANYGGRGIQVCARWRHSFANFREDIGERPTPEHSIDRVNNDGNYEPGNMRWATSAEQNNNRRDNRIVEWCGEKMTAAQWARSTGGSVHSLYRSIARGRQAKFLNGWLNRNRSAETVFVGPL